MDKILIENIIAVVAILAVVIPGIVYIIRAKKKGQKCIGCPSSGGCSKCHCGDKTNKK